MTSLPRTLLRRWAALSRVLPGSLTYCRVGSGSRVLPLLAARLLATRPRQARLLIAVAFFAALPCGAAPLPLPPGVVDRSPPAALPGAMAPNWAAGEREGGALLLSWLEPSPPGPGVAAGTSRLRLARLERGRWSEPSTLVADPALFANFADFPSVARAKDGALLAHWLAKTGEGTYAYSIELARSTDGGKNWHRLGRLNDDATDTEHGFVSLVAEGDGLRAFWLDGRAMPGGGAMALRTAQVGSTVGAAEVLDERVCECCQTGAAMTDSGPLVVYRDRSQGEVRDIAAVSRAGDRWAAPRPVFADGWKIPGCPVNGPSIAARGRESAVAWFTGVAPPAGQGPRVALAFSRAAGGGFEPPVVLDAGEPLGRVSVALDDDGSAVVAWLSDAGGIAELRLQRVARDGRKSRILPLATTTAGRASGFPRLASAEGGLFVAWVEVGAEKSSARLRVAELPRGALALPAR